MIAVPFIYFSILLMIIIRKHGFDISAGIVALYVTTSLFALLIYRLDLQPLSNIPINFIPTVVYCLLISICIYPFYRFSSNKIKYIQMHNLKLFEWIVYIYFISFVLYMILYIVEIKLILSGDFSEMRRAIYRGDFSLETQYSGVLKFIATSTGFIGNFSFIMLLFFFYSIAFLDKSKWFNGMALLGSLTYVAIGILGIDRSKMFYYILIFVLLFILFYKHFSVKQIKRILLMALVVLSIMLFYIITVTNSRFSKKSEFDSKGSIIVYAGQPFIFFCDFWDHYSLPDVSTKFFLPATHKYILKDGNGATDHNAEIERKTGKNAGLFYTFLGNFLIDWGILGPFIYCMIFIILTLVFLRRKQRNSLSFSKLIRLFLLVLVPYFGAILYFYTSATLTIDAFIFFLLSIGFLPIKKH